MFVKKKKEMSLDFEEHRTWCNQNLMENSSHKKRRMTIMSYQCGFPLTPNQQHGMVPCNTVAVPPTMSPRPSIVVPPPRSLTDAAATNPMEVFSADRLEWSREEMNDTDSFDKLKDLLTVKSAVRNESQCECNHRLRLAKNIVEMKKAEGLEIIRAHQKQQQFWKNAKN